MAMSLSPSSRILSVTIMDIPGKGLTRMVKLPDPEWQALRRQIHVAQRAQS